MKKKFKPFDKVLVRRNVSKRVFNFMSEWSCALYSHYSEKRNCHIVLIGGINGCFNDSEILPYEGNEHLVGTDLPADEEVRLEEGEWLIVSDNVKNISGGIGITAKFSDNGKVCLHVKVESDTIISYYYAIRISDFNPNDMEETKKHILCVKNGKIIRYNKG